MLAYEVYTSRCKDTNKRAKNQRKINFSLFFRAKVTSRVAKKINGKSIFFPAAGSWWDKKVHEVGKSGNYWSSSVSTYPEGTAVVLYFDDEGADIDDPTLRADGNNIRPVCK